MSKYSDKDSRAYKPAPGDATAKTKPSKYTKRFHKMFSEEIGIVIEGAPEKIEGTNCANCIHWVKESEKPVDKNELNEFGGLKAPNEAYVEMAKHVDLVTLPGKANVKIKAYCNHEDIHDFVTERMCCAYWDNEDAKREFKGVSPKMDESIVKVDGKFRLVSKKTGRNLGTYDTKAGAMKRERQVQYFKSLGETMKNESKVAGVLAAMNKARPEPKVGDRVVTIKGGQNTGTVEKIKDNHVYFRSDHSQSSLGGGTHKPLYKTHISNVRLHEEKKVSFGRSGSVMHYNPKTEKSEKDGTANIYDPEKHNKKLSPKGGFAVKKRMDEEVEQVDEVDYKKYLKVSQEKRPFTMRTVDAAVKTDKAGDPNPLRKLGNTNKARKFAQKQLTKKFNASQPARPFPVYEPGRTYVGDSVEHDGPVIDEARRMSAAEKLGRAFDREKTASDASRKRGEEMLAQARAEYAKKQAAKTNEEVELDEAQKKLKPSYWRAEWRLGTQTEVDKNNKKIYDKLAKTDPVKAKAFHDNLSKMRKEEVEQPQTQREGFLDFMKRKKPEVKKPAFSHAHARAFFKKLDKQTRITSMRPNAQRVRTVYAEETHLDERIDVNKQKKNAVMRQAGVNAAISGKVPFAGSALQMGRKAAKKLPSKTLAKSYRELPRVAEEAIEEGKADTSLAAKAKKSGVSLGTLRKVYNRGVAAWNSGHRPGTTPQQWGHARVNSYITKGKTYHTADKDLRRESVDFNEAFKEEFNDEIE
jgi:hypothetical protein